MPNLLTPFSIPLRLLDDVRTIAESLALLPELIDEVRSLSRSMGEMQDDLRGLRGDLAPLPQGIQDMHAELRGMRSDLDSLPSGIADMRRELSGMRGDLGSLPGGIDRMATDLTEVLENVRPMDEDLSQVEGAVRGLVPKLDGIQQELDHLRSDLAGLPFVSKS